MNDSNEVLDLINFFLLNIALGEVRLNAQIPFHAYQFHICRTFHYFPDV
jgi:hypothetical protein